MLAQTREEGTGSPGALRRRRLSPSKRINDTLASSTDCFTREKARKLSILLLGSKRVAKQPRLAYPWPLEWSVEIRQPQGMQALMTEPIKLEIFTDYV